MPRTRMTDRPERFRRSIAEEVADGIHWPDYTHKVSKYLLPMPDADPEAAAAAIRAARRAELTADAAGIPGTPGRPPSWPHWQGTGR